MANKYELHNAVQHFDGRGAEFVVVVSDDQDASIAGHGETVYCKEEHDHSKACAHKLMKEKPVIGRDEKGKDILGKCPLDLCEEYMERMREHQRPEDLGLHTKQVKDGKGGVIDVPDRALSL